MGSLLESCRICGVTLMDDGFYLEYIDIGEGEQESVLLVFKNGEQAEIRFDGIYQGKYYVPFEAIISAIKRGIESITPIKG